MNNPEYLKRFKIDSDSENETNGKSQINSEHLQQPKVVKDSICIKNDKNDKEKINQNNKRRSITISTK